MKKLSSLFVLLCASVMMSFAADVVAFCDFTKKSASHANYNDTWTYADWSVYGAANNNGQWTYAKFGGKSTTLANANPCYIFGQVTSPVTKIVVTTNAGNLSKAGSVNEWGVNVYSDAQKTNLIANVKGGTMTKSKSETLELVPTTDAPWTGKSYYQVYFKMSNTTTTNGIVWVDKIEFYAEPTEAVPATGITVDKTTLSLENYKNTVALNATLTPDNATDEIVWTSANEEIATISKMGVISALKEGTVTLTATAGTVSATCELTVTAPTILTCAQAVEIASAVSANNVKAENGKYVVRGYMTKAAGKGFESDMSTFGNITFWMADERGTAQTFEAYQVKPLDTENLPEVGALVEIVGDLTKYNTTAETTGGGSATLRVIENAPIQYELNGGKLASTPAPATTNEDLWKVFMPAYNKYYNLNRSEQTIDKVSTFASAKMQEIMTDATSDWKWLGDYVLSVATAQGYTVDSETTWRWTMHAFFNCSEKDALVVKVAGFTEAGKPEKWLAVWDATHSATLPEHPTEETVLPTPTREGYQFAGWYNNAAFEGEPITTVGPATKGTIYAKWEVEAIAVTGIKLDQPMANMIVGETLTLVATITPEDATNQNIVWTSSDETKATVKDGVVTALAATDEDVTITATTEDGQFKAECLIWIYPAIESIAFSKEFDTTFEYEEYLQFSLYFDVEPYNASTKGLIVTSSNEAVATIESREMFGTVMYTLVINGVGTTTLKVTTADGKLSDEMTITVLPAKIHATEIALDKTELTLNVEQTYTFAVTLTPAEAEDNLTWTSSNEDVATIADGVVTAKNVGTTYITVTTDYWVDTMCKVTVKDKGTGLENISELNTNAPMYNVLGEQVNAEYKGIVIQNGKKFLLQ